MSGFNIEFGANSIGGPKIGDELSKGFRQKESGSSEGGKTTFSDLLSNQLSETSKLHENANASVSEMLTGKNVDLHSTMLAVEKADISFRLLMQLRNKMVDAYREVMRMQV